MYFMAISVYVRNLNLSCKLVLINVLIYFVVEGKYDFDFQGLWLDWMRLQVIFLVFY